MTDEEIEKALECCQWAVKACKECPLDSNTPCMTNLHTATLAYMRRLKEENKRLKENYDNLYDFKRKLEDELTERGFAEYYHGDFRILSDEEKEQIRKETAKEILQALCEPMEVWTETEDSEKSLQRKIGGLLFVEKTNERIKVLAEKYGVEVEA